MAELWLACLIWLGTHLGISSTGVRGWLVARIGQGAYLGLYSAIAAGSLVYLVWVYAYMPRFEYLWLPNPDLYWLAKLTMPVACVLLLGGFMVRNPTNVGMTLSDAEQAQNMATGVTRITRHPLQWSVVIWSIGHLVANGDRVSVLFFSTFLILGLAGGVLIDRKKASSGGDAWQAYAAVTSNLPFAAIVSGRNRMAWSELLWPLVAGVVLYVLFYLGHEWLTGAVIV